MPLNDDLKKLYATVMSAFSPDLRNQLISENEKLFYSFIGDKVIKAGDKVPEVKFYNEQLNEVSLQSFLDKGHVVLSFYRGSWCPFCSMELVALNRINDDIKKRGAQLITVSPELLKFSKEELTKNHINCASYTDLGNKAADQFGLVFELPPEYQEIYKKINIHLNVLNNESGWLLPVPATFIISSDGIIRAEYVNINYTQRMEPGDILMELDKLHEI